VGHIIHKVERPRESETSQGNAGVAKRTPRSRKIFAVAPKVQRGSDSVAFGPQVPGPKVFCPKVQRTKGSLAGGTKYQSLADQILRLRLRTHNQKMTVAAMQIAEKNNSPHLS
jgi:hypothetical protein